MRLLPNQKLKQPRRCNMKDINLYEKQYWALRGYTKEEDLNEDGLGANLIFYGGAAGGGKSFLIRWMAILFCMQVPGLQVYIFRRKYNELMSNHVYNQDGLLNTLKPYIDSGFVQVNMSEFKFTFNHTGPEGPSNIFLRHAHRETDVYSQLGAEFGLLIVDESVSFTPKMLKFLLGRTRLSNDIDYDKFKGTAFDFIKPGFFPRAVLCSNPGGLSHGYHKRKFIEPMPPTTIRDEPEEEGGMRTMFIPAKLTDNKVLMERDPKYASRLKALGGALAKQMLDGDWSVADGGAVSDLWDSEKQVIEQIEVPKNAVVYRSCDWGSFHPTAVHYYIISNGEMLSTIDGREYYLPTGSIVVVGEIYTWNGNENEGTKISAYDVGKRMAEYEVQHNFTGKMRKGPGDNQIFQNRGGAGETIESHLVRGYNDYMEEVYAELNSANSAKSRFAVPHIAKTTSLFNRADQSHNSRVQGLEILRTYLNASKEDDGRAGIYFTPAAYHAIRTIPSIPRDELRPEDVDTKSEDHCYDSIRYFCMSRRSSFKKLQISGL